MFDLHRFMLYGMFVSSQCYISCKRFYNKMRSKFTDCNHDYQAKSVDYFNFLHGRLDRIRMLKYFNERIA